MLLQDWCEVGWSPLGTRDLAAGAHALEIRIPRPYKDEEKKQVDRVIFAVDALAVAPQGGFRPNGPHAPGSEWRTQADRDAEAFRFELPEAPADGARAELSLAGTWQYARWSEDAPIYSLKDMDEEARAATEKALPGGGTILVKADGTPVWHRAGPVPEAPAAETLDWSSIAVPGDRNALRPDQSYAHRYFYRTRLFVPASWKGGSLFLDFERCNLLTSVFVNGRLVATSDAAASGFHADISAAVRAGENNEIWVGVKDAYYAYDPPADKKDLRLAFNLPHRFLGNVQGISWRLDFPTASSIWTGIFQSVKVVASPAPAYADDVYPIPSVDEKSLTVEVTIPGGAARAGKAEVSAAVLDADGKKVLDLPAVETDIPAEDGKAALVSLKADWAGARLWSPEDPYLYTCVATVKAGGRADVSTVPFGFRQWKVEGRHLLLNGVPWQMRATTDYHGCGARRTRWMRCRAPPVRSRGRWRWTSPSSSTRNTSRRATRSRTTPKSAARGASSGARSAVRPRRCTDFAEAGRRVLVLEQDQTLHFQALPADIETTGHSGAFAFPQNPNHPAFAGLDAGDFSLWTGGHGVYTNAFVQPTRGADSLVQCGPALSDCALAQCTPGEGLVLLCQLAVGTKLAAEPVAGILFDNLVRHGLAYRPLRRPVAVLLPAGPRMDAIAGSTT